MRVARSGLWLHVWASRNCLLEESKCLSASIPASRGQRAGTSGDEGGVSEACRLSEACGLFKCGLVDRLARTLVPRILSLAFLRHEREPWEQGCLLARLLEYKVVNYDAIELVAAINRFVVY